MTFATKTADKKVVVLIILIIALMCLGAGIYIFRDKLFKPKLPLEYTQIIADYSNKYNLDPYLVCAVINTESGFDEKAKSEAGAIGLMQIMPATGDWIAEKLDLKDFNSDLLFNPDTNIEFGCWYLNFLSERFNDDIELISAAYNAGHNRVWNWMEDKNIFVDGKLKNIPYEETKNYVKKVNEAYQEYKKEYPDAFVTS